MAGSGRGAATHSACASMMFRAGDCEGSWLELGGGELQGEMADESPEAFVKTLTENDELLLVLRDELYGGSWERFLRDLDDRLKGRPYVFKLVNRIEEDIERIHRLQRYERDQGVDLARFLPED